MVRNDHAARCENRSSVISAEGSCLIARIEVQPALEVPHTALTGSVGQARLVALLTPNTRASFVTRAA
jgi:hypothetical protein